MDDLAETEADFACRNYMCAGMTGSGACRLDVEALVCQVERPSQHGFAREAISYQMVKRGHFVTTPCKTSGHHSDHLLVHLEKLYS